MAGSTEKPSASAEMDILDIRAKLTGGQFEFSRHAFRRVVERNISDEEIRQVGSRAEIIEDYPHD